VAGFEILDETEPLNPGRFLLNQMYSGMTIYWSGGTGTDSLIRNRNTQTLKNTSNSTGSWAGGISNAATNTYAVTLWGSGNTAQTAYSTVIQGKINTVSGDSSLILNGSGNSINSHFSIIGNGISNTIQGGSPHSTILGGYFNVISGNSPSTSIIGGSGNTIYGDQTTIPAWGSNIIGGEINTIVGTVGLYSAVAATAIGGQGNKVRADYSLSMGVSNTNTKFASVSMGGGGRLISNPYTLSIAGSIGSSASSVNNTISLHGNTGEGYAEGGFSTGPADIAEMFQFADGNPNSEDRRGFFVSILSADTIEIGNKNIIGVVSANPGYIGDSAELKWSGIYVKDEFGGRLKEKYKTLIWTDNGVRKKVFQSNDNINYTEYPNPSSPLGIIYSGNAIPNNTLINEIETFKINPEFNPKQEYQPRSKRKEWAPIGLLGKIVVRTAEEINSTHVDADENGMAINGTKYIVIQKIEPYQKPYGLVQIFIK